MTDFWHPKRQLQPFLLIFGANGICATHLGTLLERWPPTPTPPLEPTETLRRRG